MHIVSFELNTKIEYAEDRINITEIYKKPSLFHEEPPIIESSRCTSSASASSSAQASNPPTTAVVHCTVLPIKVNQIFFIPFSPCIAHLLTVPLEFVLAHLGSMLGACSSIHLMLDQMLVSE